MTVEKAAAAWKSFSNGIPSIVLRDSEKDADNYHREIDRLIRSGFASQPDIDPYQIEILLAQVSRAIEQCLSHEREYQAVRAQALSAYAEIDLFRSQLATLREIERDDDASTQRAQEVAAHQAAAGIFGGGADPLAAGNKALYEGLGIAAQTAAGRELRRSTLVGDKWKLLEDHQIRMLGRLDEPGGALNFKDRAGKLRELIVSEMEALAPKLYAIEAGARQVFKLDKTDLLKDGFISLTDTIIWIRSIINRIEIVTRDEGIYHFTFPLKRKLPGRENPPLGAGWDDRKITDSVEMTFKLDGYIPDFFENVRLRSAGLSVFVENGTPPDATLGAPSYINRTWYRVSAFLTPPPQPNPYSLPENDFLIRRPAWIPYISYEMLDTPPASMDRNPTFVNIDPRAGVWTLNMSNAIHQWALVTNQWINNEWIKDINIHITIAARLNQEKMFAVSL